MPASVAEHTPALAEGCMQVQVVVSTQARVAAFMLDPAEDYTLVPVAVFILVLVVACMPAPAEGYTQGPEEVCTLARAQNHTAATFLPGAFSSGISRGMAWKIWRS